MVTCKTPGTGRDILQASANNLYDGVTMADLEAFQERYPLNSRVVRRNGAVVEEVYRVGGLYDAEIRQIVCHLEQALPYAPGDFGEALTALIRWYQTGEDADREAFDIAWVQQPRLRGRHDERVHRGLHGRARHQGRVGRRRVLRQPRKDREDSPARGRTRSGSRTTCRLTRAFRKPSVQGISARAIEVVFETGDSGPVTPIGVNLPNDQRIRERIRQQVRLAVERDRGVRSSRRSTRFGRNLPGTRTRSIAPSDGARLPAS